MYIRILALRFLSLAAIIASLVFTQEAVAQGNISPESNGKDTMRALVVQSAQSGLRLDSIVTLSYDANGGLTGRRLQSFEEPEEFATLERDVSVLYPDSTVISIDNIFIYDDGQDYYEIEYEDDSEGNAYPSLYFNRMNEAGTRGYSYTQYGFNEQGDTTYAYVGRADTIETPDVRGPDFKIVFQREDAFGVLFEFSERYSTLRSKLPEYIFFGSRSRGQFTDWSDGTFHSYAKLGDVEGGDYVELDSIRDGLVRSRSALYRIYESTFSREIVSATKEIDIEEFRLKYRGTLSPFNRENIKLFNIQGQLVQDSSFRYGIGSSSGNPIPPSSFSVNNYTYLPSEDLLEFRETLTLDYTTMEVTRRRKAQYYYSQVSSTKPVNSLSQNLACFDRSYIDGSNVVVFPSNELGEGQLTLLSIDGKRLAQYQLAADKQLLIERPSVSGLYILSFSGKEGVCSQQIFVP